MKNIQELLARHEAMKSKGLRLTDWDIMEWINILDAFIDISVELESEYEEAKRHLDNIFDTEHILLKEQEGGSDKVIAGKVKSKYENELIELAKMKKWKTLAKAKQESINHYINQGKRIVK